MVVDDLLRFTLSELQKPQNEPAINGLISHTSRLLTLLHHHRNLSLLTSELLLSPAVWGSQHASLTALRVMSVYSNAASTLCQSPHATSGALSSDDWARAVVRGIDDHSESWKHLLILTGILVGSDTSARQTSMSTAVHNSLQQAVVTAANKALLSEERGRSGPTVAIVTALAYAFPKLSEWYSSQLECSHLLPIVLGAITGEDGFRDGRFLDLSADKDAPFYLAGRLSWPVEAPSYLALLGLEAQPLMANMGPISRLASFALQRATDTLAVVLAHDALLLFTNRVLDAWRRSPFSDIDLASDKSQLTAETAQRTWPLLWQILQRLLFTSLVVLEALVKRSLLDPVLSAPGTAAKSATKSLCILRNLAFISSRDGSDGLETYTFIYLLSIDALAQDCSTCQAFLLGLAPPESEAGLPLTKVHLRRTLDVFYLHLGEQLLPVLPTESCEALVVRPAMAHVCIDQPMSRSMMKLYEAAHSALISVLSNPQLGPLAVQMASFYIPVLFGAFPRQISSRQFRMAFTKVMESVSSPYPASAVDPQLSETLLEMIRCRLETASAAPLPTLPLLLGTAAPPQAQMAHSEQSTLAMALIDSLPVVPLALLDSAMTFAAQAMNNMADPALKTAAQAHFRNVLLYGDMDMERAVVGVAWWGTRGGQEQILHGSSPGAITDEATGVVSQANTG